MTWLTFIPFTVFFIAAWPSRFAAPPPRPDALPAPPALECTDDVRLIGLRPNPDRAQRESVWLWNLEPVALDLSGHELVVKRRTLRLTGVHVEPGARIEVAAPPMNNAGGEIQLRAPCGVITSRARWPRAERGKIYTVPVRFDTETLTVQAASALSVRSP